MTASTQNQTPPETSGCLSVLLPATPEFPQESSARFVLMTPESYLQTLHSGKLLEPLVPDSKDSDFAQAF